MGYFELSLILLGLTIVYEFISPGDHDNFHDQMNLVHNGCEKLMERNNSEKTIFHHNKKLYFQKKITDILLPIYHYLFCY